MADPHREEQAHCFRSLVRFNANRSVQLSAAHPDPEYHVRYRHHDDPTHAAAHAGHAECEPWRQQLCDRAAHLHNHTGKSVVMTPVLRRSPEALTRRPPITASTRCRRPSLPPPATHRSRRPSHPPRRPTATRHHLPITTDHYPPRPPPSPMLPDAPPDRNQSLPLLVGLIVMGQIAAGCDQ